MKKKNKKSNDLNITSKIDSEDIIYILVLTSGIVALLTIIITTIIVGIGLYNSL